MPSITFDSPALSYEEFSNWRRVVVRPWKDRALHVEIIDSLTGTLTPQQVITNDKHILVLLTCQFYETPGEPVGDLFVDGSRKHTPPPFGANLPRDYFAVHKNDAPARRIDSWTGGPLPAISIQGKTKYRLTDEYVLQRKLRFAAGALLMLFQDGQRREQQVRKGAGPSRFDYMWTGKVDRPTWSWHLEDGKPVFLMTVLDNASIPDTFNYQAAGSNYAFLGDGSDKATLWARSKDGSPPVQLSWEDGNPGTPSYVVVRHR